jgi:membrane protein
LAQTCNVIAGFVVTTVMFAKIDNIMPRVSVMGRDVWLGAAVTALLFTVGQFLIGFHAGLSNLASGFCDAGSLSVVFAWVCYAAQIFLLGAEFTGIYASTFGSMRAMQPQILAKTHAPVPGLATDLPDSS